MDSLEDRQKTFFANCSKNKLKGSEKDEYESIRKEYQKVNVFVISFCYCRNSYNSGGIQIKNQKLKNHTSDFDRLSKTRVRKFS